jgi:hypothetical protein
MKIAIGFRDREHFQSIASLILMSNDLPYIDTFSSLPRGLEGGVAFSIQLCFATVMIA